MIHNYIRHTQLFEDEFYAAYDNEEEEKQDEEQYVTEEIDEVAVESWRDSIAQAMWESYVSYLATRANI